MRYNHTNLLVNNVDIESIVSSEYADLYRIVLERMTSSAWNAKEQPYMLSHVCFFFVTVGVFSTQRYDSINIDTHCPWILQMKPLSLNTTQDNIRFILILIESFLDRKTRWSVKSTTFCMGFFHGRLPGGRSEYFIHTSVFFFFFCP